MADVEAAEALMRPASETHDRPATEVMADLRALLAWFPERDVPPEVLSRSLIDLVSDLIALPMWAVRHGIDHVRRTSRFHPVPAEFYAPAREATDRAWREIEAARARLASDTSDTSDDVSDADRARIAEDVRRRLAGLMAKRAGGET